MGQLLLAVALLAKSNDLRGLALDALITVIADGRCQGIELGGIYRRLLPSGMVRCNRLAEAVNTAARASERHALTCAKLVQAMFSEVETLPDDAHQLLTPLLEWLTELRRPVAASLRTVLEQVTGSSKTARVAKSLLKL